MSGADKTSNSEKSFRVVIRLCALNRPDHSIPLAETRTSIKVTNPNRVVVDTGKNHKPHVMDFDAVLNESSQRDVYESTTKSLVEYLMQGYNGCIIAYGSPGSGKTHTMQGSSVSAKHRGIISRAAEDIFTSPNASHCKIRVSFYHIFNEKIYDLLDPKGSEVIWMRDCDEVVRLDGLTEMEVSSAQDLLQVHCRGSALRHTGISKGDFPSRSHTVFSIVVINTIVQSNGGGLTASKLTLVDLASSGKCRSSTGPGVKKMIHGTNDNPQEAKMLKRSLAIFRNVIFALGSVGSQHVPYRESKLTRALRDCLGGNCRTCLVVTVSSQPSLISDALSSLQFASRAMTVPSHPIYTSQLHYPPEQTCSSHLNGKKDVNHLNRQQILPPVGSDKRSQSSLLPVLLSSGSSSEPKPSSGHCGDGLELRTFLPQLEKPGQAEPGGRYSRGSRPVDDKNKADGRLTRSLSRCLSGAVLHEAGAREKPEKRLEFSPGPRCSVERLSMTPHELSVAPSTAVECLNCSRERKIREEYDKIIVQARRDKDALSQKVSELENQLRRRGTQHRQDEEIWQKKLKGHTVKAEPTSRTSEVSGTLQTAEVCVQTEAEGRRVELCVCGEREKHSERLTQDTQKLHAQLDSTRKQNSHLHDQLKSLLVELQSSREKLEKFEENASRTLGQLQTEKAELLSHLEDTKNSYERVCLENSDLRQKLKSFLRELNSGPFTGSSSPETPDTNTSHRHTVTTNTEMIVLSHHVSEQCPAGHTQGNECRFSQFQHPEGEFTEKCETTNSSYCEQPLCKSPNVYKQLRREHSLLLDVMQVLYRREWFLQDAIPYVRRTLRKCGLKPEDID